MHRVSDRLRDRHPYADQPFQESYNNKEVTRVFGVRAIPKYAELLAMEDLPYEDRCRALRDLREMLSSPNFKYMALMKEIMFTCADLTHSLSTEVRSDAALVMASLVLFEMGTPNDLSDEVVLTTATRLLCDDEEDVVAAGCRILINLTVANEGCLLLANKIEAITTLAKMLTSQPLSKLPARIVELLVEVLANLTRINEGARICAQFPIITPVLSLVKKPRLCRAETLLHSAMVITNVAAYDKGRLEAIQLNAVELCLKALSKVLLGQVRCESAEKRDELTRCLVTAVMALSTAEDAKPRVIEFGIEPLTQCLTHTNTAVRQNANITINSACDLPRGVTPFTQRLLRDPDLLVEVLGIKAVSALNKNVSSFDDEDTPAAAKALAAIQKKDAYGTADRIVQTLDMLHNLVKALGESEVPAETQQGIAEVLRRMGQTDTRYRRRVGKCMVKNNVPEALFTQILGLTLAEFDEQLA
ncbi:Flagellar radial spoke protein [Phytophthora palmivora]|uniref:Flagellar radial spoke protein n=1 Tax=Phytophthora palmivora TaxID=4796 RepID=A0A2P4XJA8_9STRA|nr:Flagellar radial spoke protein [Phytophthora palmivora]